MSKEQFLIDQINREQERAEIYLIQYNDNLKPVQDIMQAYGILTGMLSDILYHELQKGVSPKSQIATKRVTDLMEIVESFSKLSDHNKQLRLSVTDGMNRQFDLENENEKLKAELAGISKAWEQTA
jgi:hypothetical protein